MRSPNPSNCNNVRNVNSSGALNNNNANNTYGAADDCEQREPVDICSKGVLLTHRELLSRHMPKLACLTGSAYKRAGIPISCRIFRNMTDFERATTLSELEKAARQCARGLMYKSSVSGYLLDSLAKNNRLRNELLGGTYKISKYMHFTITEPKRREICATRMRDRVWQKSMCNNGLRDQMLRPLIYDNGACQKNKGVDFAIDRAICFLQRYFREHGNNDGRYDHLDVKGYFPNTPHSQTERVTLQYVRDIRFKEHVIAIIKSFKDPRPPEVIEADPFGERGTALGSEISQLLQLAVPSHIDHAVKEQLRISVYIRFNDDILIISDSKGELEEARKYIIEEYAKIGLQVTIKQKYARISQGINFLKRRIILTDTGKVIVKADPKKFSAERRRLQKMKGKLERGEMTMQKIADHYQSVKAGLARCDEKAKVKALDLFYERLFGTKPPTSKRRKKNAYCKSKSECRKARGKHGRTSVGECKTEGDR